MSAHYVTTRLAFASCSCGWACDGRTLAGARDAAARHESSVRGTVFANHSADLEPVKFDPPLTEAEADAYWDAISDEPESGDPS